MNPNTWGDVSQIFFGLGTGILATFLLMLAIALVMEWLDP